jgi:micrococcal nuclease
MRALIVCVGAFRWEGEALRRNQPTLRLAAFLACVSIVLAAYPATAEEFRGKVVGITAGDTLSVLREGRAVTARLQGIDAPERRQPFGTRAKQYASSLAFGQGVTVHVKARDRNQRLLADGRNLNHELVRAGFAWGFRRYSKDAKLEALEAEARSARRGLWVDPNAVPPWEWRQAVRQGT